MELLLRFWTARNQFSDLCVDPDPTHTVGELSQSVADFIGMGSDSNPPLLTNLRTGLALDNSALFARSGVVSGDELLVGSVFPVDPVPSIPIKGVTLDVLAGIDAGSSVVLGQGAYWIGRDPSCDLILSDPTVSRRHVRVEIRPDWSVDLSLNEDSQNGVYVNEQLAIGQVTVGDDDVVALGSTRLAFRSFIRASDEVVDQLGQIEFHRTPYRPHLIPEATFKELGPVPASPEPRRFQILSAVTPLGAGLAMFAFSGQVQFLALTLLSPVAIFATWLEERRSGRKKHGQRVLEFRQQVNERREALEQAIEHERVARFRASPDLAELARRCEFRTVDLWARGRDADDFLTLRLGLGSAPTLITSEVSTQGDQDLIDEAQGVLDGFQSLSGVPIEIAIQNLGTVGIHGSPDHVDAVAASLLVQAAALHSPEDLIICAGVDPARDLSTWLKWLPHSRAVTSPVDGKHVVSTTAEIDHLVAHLIQVAVDRLALNDRSSDHRWPWVLAVLNADLNPQPAAVSQLLDLCPESGISVIWIAESRAEIPRQARGVINCDHADEAGHGVYWQTDPHEVIRELEITELRGQIASRVARALAPVRDASAATATTAIPRVAPLFSVLGAENPDANWVTERWKCDFGYQLRHPVGLGPNGPIWLDLVADGPHSLIGGTSGAGKSELLQSMVASLASIHPPTRLNFLFVDYKGGASSTVFKDIPHTVGYVTNLDGQLSLRALTSLRAELNRRMRLMEGRAKDLEEMLAKYPDECPASLVIVVDEFATLVKEIPEFVDGIVDIAQRGRSLGIHLILATQRPTGSVNDNILANTNLRISLRMLDSSESSAIIGTKEAAEIPAPLRGRGFVRLGPRELIPFQSAYSSAPAFPGETRTSIRVTGFPEDAYTRSGIEVVDIDRVEIENEVTQLSVLIEAIAEAHRNLKLPPARVPWREMLPDVITTEDLLVRADFTSNYDAGRDVLLGLVDEPETQDQYPACVDLEAGGGLLIFGSGGSGKSTLLRSIALGTAVSASTDEVNLFVFDFASRSLGNLAKLPHTAAYAAGDDLEAVTRAISVLETDATRRRDLLASGNAENLTAFRGKGGLLERVLVLIDGYGSFLETFTGGGYAQPLDSWVDRMQRLIVDGRQLGIHFVITADRRVSVPGVIQSAISDRVILRLSDENSYSDHGIRGAWAPTLSANPGRALLNGVHLMQSGVIASPSGASEQAERIDDVVTTMSQPNPRLLSKPLPASVAADEVGESVVPLVVPLGLADISCSLVLLDLDWSNCLVVGPPRSGRSTALETIGRTQVDRCSVWAVGPASSPLAGAGLPGASFGNEDQLLTHLEAVLREADHLTSSGLLLVDDLDLLESLSLSSIWEQLAKHDKIRIAAAVDTVAMAGFTSNALLIALRRSRRILVLGPSDPGEFYQQFGIRTPIRPGTSICPGRAVLIADRIPTTLQIAVSPRS